MSRNWYLALFIFCLHVVPFALEFVSADLVLSYISALVSGSFLSSHGTHSQIAFHFDYSAMYIAGVGCVAFDHESYHIYRACVHSLTSCTMPRLTLTSLQWYVCIIARSEISLTRPSTNIDRLVCSVYRPGSRHRPE